MFAFSNWWVRIPPRTKAFRRGLLAATVWSARGHCVGLLAATVLGQTMLLALPTCEQTSVGRATWED